MMGSLEILILSTAVQMSLPRMRTRCDELNQYENGDAVKRAKARSIGSSILGSKAKERREEEQSGLKSCSLSKLPVTCFVLKGSTR